MIKRKLYNVSPYERLLKIILSVDPSAVHNVYKSVKIFMQRFW